MVEFQPSKLVAWVRFPSLAPFLCALSSVDRVPGYEPVGRRFESSRARHKEERHPLRMSLFFLYGSPCSDSTLHLHRKCEGSHIPPEDRKACFSGEGSGYIHEVNTLRGAFVYLWQVLFGYEIAFYCQISKAINQYFFLTSMY